MYNKFCGTEEGVFARGEGSGTGVRVAAGDCDAEPFKCLDTWKGSANR